ncbi:hypothetical protein SADUNF_Sadunf17G0098200 [Salix dunnii]|uniref:Uncharacterized protein n=1 Tax=Salix dunnii TaxID=1413687 RepID=A0A835J6D9_9ROSI|nr:hypothetical protein SADUNF_Sadunf17G0098200 [Salix dunnii]
MTDMLLEKLYNMGVIPSRKSLALCDRLSVSCFCSVLWSVTDPSFLVTRNMEDFVTWVDTSKIKRKVLEYNEKLDDYDAMN